MKSSASVRGERAWPSPICVSTPFRAMRLLVREREPERLLGGQRHLAHVAAAPAAALDGALEVVHPQRPVDLARQTRPACERGCDEGRIVVPSKGCELQ